MANDIGIRIGVDGEKEFKTALSAINAQLKNLSSEMKATVTSMTGMDTAESLLFLLFVSFLCEFRS